MERKPHSTGSIVGAVVLLVVVLLSLYVGGYFALGEYDLNTANSGKPLRIRVFHSRWQIRAYRPMARIESAVAGYEVLLMSLETDQFGERFSNSSQP